MKSRAALHCSGLLWTACSLLCSGQPLSRSGLVWAALVCSGLFWAVLGCFGPPGLLQAVVYMNEVMKSSCDLGGGGELLCTAPAGLGCSGLLWAVLGCSGLLWAAWAAPGCCLHE